MTTVDIADSATGEHSRARVLGQFRELALLPAIVLAVVVGALVVGDKFLTVSNFLSIGQESSELAIVVVAESLILIVGRIDLSLQSIYGLAPTVGVWLAVPAATGGSGARLDPFLAILITLLVGAVIGVLNGLMVAHIRLNAFILTLAMLIFLEGVQLGITSGKTLYQLPASMLWFGTASWLGVPVDIWIAAIVYLIVGLALRYTSFGRSVYAVGGRALSARAAGINDRLVVVTVFLIGGAFAAFAGLMLTARLTAVSSNQGNNVIFSVFAAAVIGGVSLNGGKGRIVGALTGVVLLGLITNILTLSGMQPFWIDAASGLIILLALFIARFTSGEADEAAA